MPESRKRRKRVHKSTRRPHDSGLISHHSVKTKSYNRKKKIRKKKQKRRHVPLHEDFTTSTMPSDPRENEATMTRKHFLVVSALWAIEVPQVVTEAWKTATLGGQVLETSRKKYADFNLSPLAHSLLVVLTFAVILIVSVLSRNHSFKLRLVIAGMYIYIFTNIFGIIVIFTQNEIFGIIMHVLETAWQAISPLRFFLIFHQFFPIRIFHSRSLTSFNEGLISAASYLSLIFIAQSKGFTVKTYLVAWLTMFGLTLCWIISFHFIKKYVREAPFELADIRYVYERTEVLDSFDHRNERLTAVLLVLILIPSGIFPILTKTLSAAVQRYNGYFFFRYRIDMLVAVAVTSVLEMILDTFKKSRDEMEDLWAIGLGHLVNILSLVLMLVAAPGSPPIGQTRSASGVAVLVVLHPLIWGEKLKFRIDGKEPFKKTADRQYTTAWVSIDGSRYVILEGYLSDNEDKNVFKGAVFVSEGMSTFYFVRHEDGEIEEVPWPLPEPEVSKPKWVFFNLEELCDQNVNDTKLEHKGECASVQLRVSLYQGTNSTDVELTTYVSVPPTLTGTATYTSVLRPHTAVSEIAVDLIQNYENIHEQIVDISRNTSMTFFIVKDGDELKLQSVAWPDQFYYEEAPTTAFERVHAFMSITALTGLSIGISEVTYIHFIWILAPYRNRVPILSVYFAIDYAANELGDAYFESVSVVTPKIVWVLIGVQVVLTVWHVVCSFYFKRTLPIMSEDVKLGDRRF